MMNDCINHIVGLLQSEIAALLELASEFFRFIDYCLFISNLRNLHTSRLHNPYYPLWLVYDDFRHQPATGRRIKSEFF